MAASPGRRARGLPAPGGAARAQGELLPLPVAEESCERTPGPPPPLPPPPPPVPLRTTARPPARPPAPPSPQVGGGAAEAPRAHRPSPARRAPAAASCSRAAGNGRRAGEGRRAAARGGWGPGAAGGLPGAGDSATKGPRPLQRGPSGRAPWLAARTRVHARGPWGPLPSPRLGAPGVSRGAGGAAQGREAERAAAPFHPKPACIAVDLSVQGAQKFF